MKNGHSEKQAYKDILHLAWPAIAEQLLVMMVGIVSTIFVGRIGTEYLAAVGLINMIIVFFQTIFAGLATGSTVIIARLTGEGDIIRAKTALMQSLFIGAIAGLLITVPGYVFASPILKLFFSSAEARVLEIGLQYYKIVLIGLPFLVVDLVVAGAIRGSGDTRTPMYITLIVNVINVILSSLLIFGVNFGGHVFIPAYGIAGAAISVMVSRISGGIIRVSVVYLKKGKINLSLSDKYTIDLKMAARIINVGLPAFLEQFVMQGGFLIMQIMIISMGTIQAASYQVGVNVNSFAFMPVFGFAVAATTMVGQNLGSGNYEDAEMYAFESNKIAVAVIFCIGILLFIFARPLASMYTTDVAVINTSMVMIRIFTLLDPFLGIMNVSAGVLRAAGDIIYVMVSAIVGLWLFRILIAYILYRFFGFDIYAVMVGIAADFCVRAFMYGLRVKAGRWKRLKV